MVAIEVHSALGVCECQMMTLVDIETESKPEVRTIGEDIGEIPEKESSY